jgi:hypothetical protein
LQGVTEGKPFEWLIKTCLQVFPIEFEMEIFAVPKYLYLRMKLKYLDKNTKRKFKLNLG